MTTADLRMDELLGDMNGPLGYWGPAVQGASLRASRPQTPIEVRHEAEHLALERLAETLNYRTWTGTAMLMDAALIQADVESFSTGLAAA